MSGLFSDLTEYFHKQMERHRNLPFLKATMGVCALVAIADGTVSLAQRLRMDQILEGLSVLAVFDPHEGVNLFNDYIESIKANPEQGRADVLALITKPVENDPEAANLLIKVSVAVSSVKAQMSMVEQVEIVSLCTLLGVDPSSVGLYSTDDLN